MNPLRPNAGAGEPVATTWLRPADVAKRIGVSVRTIYAACKEPELPYGLRAARIGRGRSIVIAEGWLAEWLERLAGPKAPAPASPPIRPSAEGSGARH